MDITKAKNLKAGQTVHCPADSGMPAYVGIITSVETAVAKNIYGHEYVWVGVRGPHGHVAVWPSNRLG